MSKNSEFDASAMELSATGLRLPFVEDAFSIMWEHVQSQGPQLHDVEVPCIAANVAQAAVESNVQSLTASKSTSQDEIEPVTGQGVELCGEVAMMGQDCDGKVEDVLSERDSLQARLDATASKLLEDRSSVTAAREGLEKHRKRSAASNLRFKL